MDTRNKILKSISEVLVHFVYLIFFYLLNAYFGSSDYLKEILTSIFNPDTTRNFLISILVTFSFIGMIFSMSLVLSKKIAYPDIFIAEIIFKFGVDYLYFITITSTALGSIVFCISINAYNKHLINIFFITISFLFASLILRLIHHSFNANSIHHPTE